VHSLLPTAAPLTLGLLARSPNHSQATARQPPVFCLCPMCYLWPDSSVTPKRPYPDGYPNERERQKKAEGVRFPSQIKKLPHLGGAAAARVTILHQDGTSKQWSGYPAPLPARLLTDRACSPSPARKNNSLPPYVDQIDQALPIDSGTHHDNIGNTASIPRARGEIFSQTIGKKDALRRLSY
jgi:hypothetical protein